MDERVIERAKACARRLVASGFMCAGCDSQHVCGIFELIRQKQEMQQLKAEIDAGLRCHFHEVCEDSAETYWEGVFVCERHAKAMILKEGEDYEELDSVMTDRSTRRLETMHDPANVFEITHPTDADGW